MKGAKLNYCSIRSRYLLWCVKMCKNRIRTGENGERGGTGGTGREDANIRSRPVRKLQVSGSRAGRWDLNQGSVSKCKGRSKKDDKVTNKIRTQ